MLFFFKKSNTRKCVRSRDRQNSWIFTPKKTILKRKKIYKSDLIKTKNCWLATDPVKRPKDKLKVEENVDNINNS